MEGHLLKIGRKLKLPKLQYYVLKPCGVYCYSTQDHEIPHGYIPLEPIGDISLSLGTVVESNTRLHCMKISDKRKQHVLACPSMEKRNAWITAILTAVAQNLLYESDFELRRRIDSSNSDAEFNGVFCDLHCQFTSPFWTNAEARRKTKAKRLSLADLGVMHKPSWLTKSKKKNARSKSLSCEDIHSIYNAADAKDQLGRKRSLHDLTKYLFNFSSSNNNNNNDKTDDNTDFAAKIRDPQNKFTSGREVKKRWSIFAGMPSFGGSHSNIDIISVTESKKICTAKDKRDSPVIFDTKL